jgi:hypothetical protein
MEAEQPSHGLEVWGMANRRKCSKEEMKNALETSRSIRQALNKVGLKPAGGNYYTAYRLIEELNMDTSHMAGQGWNIGDKAGLLKRDTIPLEEILVRNSTYRATDLLRKKLLKSGHKKSFCEGCKRDIWNGRPIPLELEHVNGIITDNRLENLKILCPNCHAQTTTYRGKNIGNYR